MGFQIMLMGLVSIMVGSNCPTLTEMAIHLNSCHTYFMFQAIHRVALSN